MNWIGTSLLLLACGLAWADEPVVHKRGELYGIDLAAAKLRFKPELDGLRDRTPVIGKLELESVEGGLRISGLARDARYAGVGLRDGDVLHEVNFKRVRSVPELRAALAASSVVPGMWKVDLVRDGQPLELMYFDNDDAARVASLAGQVPGPPSSSSRRGDKDDGLSATDIRDLGNGHYTITRATIDRWLANPSELATMARLVPSMHDGKPSGLKLYAIRPTSPLAHLGLQNGDELHTINGSELSTPDQALALYAGLRTATELRVTLERRGRPVTLVWTIL